MSSEKSVNEKKEGSVVVVLISLGLVCAISAGGVKFAKHLIETAPKADKKVAAEKVIPVLTQALAAGEEKLTISVMGTVQPAEEVIIKPRVSGDVIVVNPDFTEGAVLGSGSPLIEVDPKDYQLVVEDRKNQLIHKESDLKIEMGRQNVAQHEIKLLGKTADAIGYELALRKPQLKQSLAAVALAKNNLEKAQLELSRTKVKMPFDGVVMDKNIALGSQVSSQIQVARVVGVDKFWINALVPVEQLQWFDIPRVNSARGASVDVTYGNDYHCKGEVIKLLSEVDGKGRMAKILIEVKKPYELKYPLLLGAYVKVNINGRTLKNVIKVPRANIHNDNELWLCESGKLLIRKVDILWRDRDYAIIEGKELNTDTLVVSDLSTPVRGMRIADKNSTQVVEAGN